MKFLLINALLIGLPCFVYAQWSESGDNYTTGKLGVGTTLPIGQLTVNGGIDVLGEGSGDVGLLLFQPVEGGVAINRGRWFLRADLSNNLSYPYLTNRTPNGKVAIKTGSAQGGSENLHFTIEGGDGFVNAYFESTMLGIGVPNPDANLHVFEDSNGNGSTMFLDADDNLNPNLMFGVNGQRFANIRVKDSGNDQLQFMIGSSLLEAMSIDTLGNVGIGNTNPTEKLVVDGIILAEEIKVQIVPSSDYVFEPDYKLKPIEEVETYIKENKHLPDIPSTEQFKENGVGLGEMDDMLLRKVEELTLYVIKQQKELELLKDENQELAETAKQQENRIEQLESK